MKEKYIIYDGGQKERRKMAVIDWQLYYQSTGLNSNTPLRWFPAIMLLGTKKIKLENTSRESFLPEIDGQRVLREFEKHRNDEEYRDTCVPGYIIKLTCRGVDDSVPASEKVLYEESDPELPLRLPLKKHLITSYRLNSQSFGEKNLTKTGLTAEEIKLAKKPLELEKSPALISSDPDKINDWLLRQGLVYIGELTQRFPDSYTKIWKGVGVGEEKIRVVSSDKESSQHEIKISKNQDPNLECAKALLSDYAKKGFLYFHGGRKYRDEVAEELTKKHLTTESLIFAIKYNIYTNTQGLIDSNGSLSQRLLYIESHSNMKR